MTNEISQSLKKIGKVFLVLFLLVLASMVMSTFIRFSNMEKKLKAEDVDYASLKSINNSGGTDKKLDPQDRIDRNLLIEGDGSNYALGTSKPKLTIVEFADFSCPYCKRSFSKAREISIRWGDQVRYIFRDLPIIQEYSASLALAARCAGDQGLFWSMHDRLFLEQGAKYPAEIELIAQKSGVEMSKFKSCFEKQTHLEAIRKDYSDAVALGIESVGTPVWFINGQQVSGDIPEETFYRIIKEILAQ
jgi:protein-disulfide isomerase